MTVTVCVKLLPFSTGPASFAVLEIVRPGVPGMTGSVSVAVTVVLNGSVPLADTLLTTSARTILTSSR